MDTWILRWPERNRCWVEVGKEEKHLQLVIGDRNVSVEKKPNSTHKLLHFISDFTKVTGVRANSHTSILTV